MLAAFDYRAGPNHCAERRLIQHLAIEYAAVLSGAEFANRPGFLRLMNALKPRAPFQVLIMSEESRPGREQLDVGYSLKQIMQAGARVFF